MKEEIKDILETGTCISHIRIQEITTKIHRLFLQKQIELLEGLKHEDIYLNRKMRELIPIENIREIITSLRNQLDNE